MALKSSIFKATLNISDMDRHYYQEHKLTIARHPSETDERMMLRIAVFALHATENLSFTKGLSTDDEPDLWQKNLSEEIEQWIELGQPDEKRMRQASGKSKRVCIYCYATKSAEVWWQKAKDKFSRFDNLDVYHISESVVAQLSKLADKNMLLQATIQDGVLWLSDNDHSVEISPEQWK